MKKTLLSFLFCGALLSAAPVSVTMVNAGSPLQTGYGFYVGPYTLNVNGVNMPAMCVDDFLETNPGAKWSANQTGVTSSDLSNTYLGTAGEKINGTSYTSGQVYTAEAYLFSLITGKNADRPDIQEAAWALMDSKTYTSAYHSNNTTVENYISSALHNSSTFNASNFSIISQAGTHSNQEFIVASAPEPGSMMLLGGALVAAGAFRFRRKKEVKA